LSISLKEANETEYWIELLHKSDYLDDKQYEQLSSSAIELIKLLTSIIKTSKKNN
jgi:four helix bundle protein